MMKRLLLGLMLLLVSGAASAGWELIRSGDRVSVYMEKASIRRNDNCVKVWDLFNWKSVQKKNGDSYLSEKSQSFV